MSDLRVFLFGKFRMQRDQQIPVGLDPCKTRELFCYLVLYRDRPHAREALADLLWGDNSGAHSKKYLRKALWQIQSALDTCIDSPDCRLLLADSEWVQLNPETDVWLDVAAFEQAFVAVQGVRGRGLDSQYIQILQNAIALYQGDLLEGCYQDWCIYERERLQHMYLAMLDKLMDHCEAFHQFELGISYGTLILRYDRARERTHRRLMRLHYLSNNRTAALRQYERCVTALDEELGVQPAKRTVVLFKEIQADTLGSSSSPALEMHTVSQSVVSPLLKALNRLKQLCSVLVDIQQQVQQDIQTVESTLSHRS